MIKGSREQGAGSREEGQRDKEAATNYQLPITNYQLPIHYVLGQELLTANQVIEEICTYLNKKIYFRIPLYPSLTNLFIVLFRIQMADWDRFCLQYRYFTYKILSILAASAYLIIVLPSAMP
ncbi:MAG: hypothetical protein N4J56_002483 [Chroococcidiopsis sp. SAG 2025]|nr:hypothetical protein [Chroococcidiopsis sp. SAG 2025]MDV2992829.1 hypothetical protein [Chroococcidiopsis sp. SAG 2025]